MSEHDGTDDPYRTPGTGPGQPPSPGRSVPGQPYAGPSSSQPYGGPPHPGQPYPGQGYPGQAHPGQPYPGQPYPGQPYPGQPYPGQPYPGQPYPGQPYPGQPYGGPGDPAQRQGADGLPAKPPAVVRLVQVMVAGAVAAVLQGLYAALVIDDVLAVTTGDLEQVAVDSGMDPARFTDMVGTGFLVFLGVSTVVTAGLWLLFARLFDRGRGRVVGTVLGAVNGATLLFGLLQPTDLIEWLLTAVSVALVVAGLVLLWRPASSAWFGAVAASRRPSWG